MKAFFRRLRRFNVFYFVFLVPHPGGEVFVYKVCNVCFGTDVRKESNIPRVREYRTNAVGKLSTFL